MRRLLIQLVLLFVILPGQAGRLQAGTGTVEALYQQHCTTCHGSERLGLSGPALLPGNLKRLRQTEARRVIAGGRLATQMPAFAGLLSDADIDRLSAYIYTEPELQPVWEVADINASRVVHLPALLEPAAMNLRPRYAADPLNLFLIVESGDHHVTVLDGDRLEPLHRFKSRHALHGGPKFSPDGRYVYLASRDGWISKVDLYTLETIVEVRAGINTRNIAVSADGRYVIAGNYLPNTLVLFDAVDLSLLKVVPVVDGNGNGSRVSAVYTAAPRESFIVALKDIKEVWEIAYSDDPEPVFQGYVHDYRMAEGLAEQGRFPVRRIQLDDYLDDFFFDAGYEHLIGAARASRSGQVINLIVGRRIAEIDLPGMPHLGSGIIWPWRDTSVLATPNLAEPVVSVIDTNTWQTITRLETRGPGFFMRSHENSRYAWVDVFSGPDKDVVHVIDKETLQIARTLRPEPGRTSGHVEFSRDGKYALLSIWELDGAVLVYDTDTLEIVKRIPASKPVGKYNVYNKINLSAGTSH